MQDDTTVPVEEVVAPVEEPTEAAPTDEVAE